MWENKIQFFNTYYCIIFRYIWYNIKTNKKSQAVTWEFKIFAKRLQKFYSIFIKLQVMFEKRKKLLRIWRAYPNYYTIRDICDTITDLGIDEAIKWQLNNMNEYEFWS